MVLWCYPCSSSRVKNKDEIDKEDKKYMMPEDCYSFLTLGWKDNHRPFAYGLLVFMFQIALLILMICSKTVRSMSSDQDNDNPVEKGFATFMPANASMVVRVTQVLSIMVFLIFPEDEGSIHDVATGVQCFPIPKQWFPIPKWSNIKHMLISLTCLLRVVQGVLACFTVFLLVMTSTDVIEIVLNFAAVNYISQIDECAFKLAHSGKYGDVLKKKAIEIKETRIDYKCLHHLVRVVPKEKERYKEGEGKKERKELKDVKWIWYSPTIVLVGFFVLVLVTYVTILQSIDDVWEAKLFRVEFDEKTGLSEYSGCYGAIEGRNKDRRAVYYKSGKNTTGLEYCKESRRWVFYKAPGDPCDETASGSHLAQSSKTNSFSVTTAFELNWISMYHKPLEMFFFDSTDETELFCDQLADDGICNTDVNNYDLKFDGGDCCGTTCSKRELCGKNEFEAFGTTFKSGKNGAIGYPFCTEPGKVNVEFHLPAADFQDKPPNNLNQLMTFWSPRLQLLCGEESRTVFSIPVSKENFNQNYSNVKVESDSVCSLIVSNLEPVFLSLNEPFSLVNLTDTDNINMLSQNSIPANFESLGNHSSLVFTGKYNLEGTIPTEIGSVASLKEVNLAKNDLNGTIPTEIGNLIDLEILVLGEFSRFMWICNEHNIMCGG